MRKFYFISLIALIGVMDPFGSSLFTSELIVSSAHAEEIVEPSQSTSLIEGIVPQVMPSPGEGSPLKATLKNGTDAFKAGSTTFTKMLDDYKKLEDNYYRNLDTFSEATRKKKEAELKTNQDIAIKYAQRLQELANVLNVLTAVDKLQDQYDDARIPVKTEGGICKEKCTSEKGCRWKKKSQPASETQ